MPMISIITVTYNAATSIEETIRSVIANKGEKDEFIVIDGGSADGTIEIINKYKADIDHYIIEPDNGIYDAMNKAIKLASGLFLYFINAGDILLTIPADELKSELKSGVKLLAFPILDSSKNIRVPAINWSIKIRNLLPHQGCFYKRDANILYDLKFKVFADFDLNQKLYLQKQQIKVYDQPIVATHDLTGISHNKIHGKEIFKVVGNNMGFLYKCISFLYFKMDGLNNRIAKTIKNKR